MATVPRIKLCATWSILPCAIQIPDWQDVINDLHNPAHALILSTKKSIKACHLMLMGQSSQFHDHLRFQDIGLARGLG